MNNAISILFRTDGDHRIGMGHVVRCLALAKELKKIIRCRISFVFRKNRVVSDLVRRGNFKIRPLHGKAMRPALKARLAYEVLIVDSPLVRGANPETSGKGSSLLVRITEKDARLPAGDIIVCPNLAVSHRLSRKRNYYSGGKYIILRESFGVLAKKGCRVKNKVMRIFACFGGSDPHDITGKIIRLLVRNGYHNKLEIVVVTGGAYKNGHKIHDYVSRLRSVKIKESVSDVSRELIGADIALVSGGTLMYEASALGTPSIVVCQNRDQEREARFLHENGAVINAGLYRDLSDKVFISSIDALLHSKRIREQLSVRSRRFIDPNGAQRIARLIVSELRKR